jgi:hypothetical protein
MTHDAWTTEDRQDASATLPPRVAAFLASYETGPGATTAEQASDLIDLSESVGRMRVLDSPFRFGTIDGFLPEELYQTVLRDWPAMSALAEVSLPSDGEPGRAYFGSRKTKLLENWAASDSGSPEAATWNRVCLALRAPAFVRSLFTRFSDVIEANLETLKVSASSMPSFKLYANFDHGAKEALGAHVDALRKLLTIVVYLHLSGALTDNSRQLWGTALYNTEAGTVRPLNFSANADHMVAHQIEFAPNRAFVMPNTSRALHGVAGGQMGVMRRTLMCGYWLTSPA